MKNSKQARILFCCMMLVIIFPFLQQNFQFFESGNLMGAVIPAQDTAFSTEAWWSSSYQQKKNAYLNDNTGCRPDIVRLNNQLDFWLFKKVHANTVVVGKDDFLFEQAYIDEYCGLDFAGEEPLRKEAIILKKIQDTLALIGKTFVFVYAPSKANFYPEKLPSEFIKKHPGTATNYKFFKRLCDSIGINYIDCNGWFKSMKDTTKNLLISRQGIHWTVYGSLLAADSLIKYLELKRHARLPEIKWHQITYSNKPRRSDDDIVKGMNLMIPFSSLWHT